MQKAARYVLDSATSEMKSYEEFAASSVENALRVAMAELRVTPDGYASLGQLKQLRDLAAEAVNETTQMCAQNVGAMSADYVRAITGAAVSPAHVTNTSAFTPTRREITEKMHASIGDVMTQKISVEEFVNRAAAYGSKMVCEMHNRAMDVMTKGDIRWARVPSGAETCKFCIMLASRNAVYHSAKAAGEHYHQNCGCRLVCGQYSAKLKRGVVNVEGYDADKYYKEWIDGIDSKASASSEKYGTTFSAERVSSLAADAVTAKAADFGDRVIEELFGESSAYTDEQKARIFEGMTNFGIEARKIERYSLTDENKARAFKLALGYGIEDAVELMMQIYEKAEIGKLVPRGSDKYGERFYQVAKFSGPNGKTAKVKTTWILEPGSSKMRLTNCYVDR